MKSVFQPKRATHPEWRQASGAERCVNVQSDTDAKDREAKLLRVLVSGVGRSGTTFAYKQIARQLIGAYGDVNFRYEPYLWNIRRDADELNPFDMTQLHHFGLQAHTETPLFLSGGNDLHDRFIDTLFNAASDADPASVPDAYLAKVIRGGGRLRAYLKRFPDLRIVACLRNPVDTINSGLGMFSFFGEEFHANDRYRFRTELEARGADVSELASPRLCVEWYAAWWRSFTEEAISVAADYPDNVFLFRYEVFLSHPQATIEALMSFVGVQHPLALGDLGVAAGTMIKTNSLTAHDLNVLSRDLKAYSDTVLAPQLGVKDAALQCDEILSRHAGSAFTFPVAGADLGRKSPIQLRDLILRGAYSPFMSLQKNAKHPISLLDLIEKHYAGDATQLQTPMSDPEAIKRGATFGVVITCRNNATTIVGAVLSCLNQSLPFDEIVVVDRNSSDNSTVLIREMAQRYSSITLITSTDAAYAASRDLGVRSLTTTFCSHLDGCDLFWPSKNAEEAAVVGAGHARIAFSDNLLVGPDQTSIEATSEYDGENSAAIVLSLLSRTQHFPRNITMARSLYFEVGGIGSVSALFLDWRFAMKLAASNATWSRVKGVVGTVRNRLETKKSEGVVDTDAVTAANTILGLLNASPATPSALLKAYSIALGPFGSADIMTLCQKALEAEINSDPVAKNSFMALVAKHNEFAKSDGTNDFAVELASFADGS